MHKKEAEGTAVANRTSRPVSCCRARSTLVTNRYRPPWREPVLGCHTLRASGPCITTSPYLFLRFLAAFFLPFLAPFFLPFLAPFFLALRFFAIDITSLLDEIVHHHCDLSKEIFLSSYRTKSSEEASARSAHRFLSNPNLTQVALTSSKSSAWPLPRTWHR